ncbi:MAG TPA: hypothetical protein VF122_06665 [Caulobacteraceae bacterium]
MIGLIAIDIFAVALTAAGFYIAFRQQLMRGVVRQRAGDSWSRPRDEDEGVDPLASVFRIAGVMLMAFGVTIGVFANLIVYFSSNEV